MATLDHEIGQAVEGAKVRAIAAHSEAMRKGMLRVGNPWEPIAEAIAFCGVVVASGDKTEYRTWDDFGPAWTKDIFAATWYVRRADAERICLTDEDGWHILPVNDVLEAAVLAAIENS